MRFGGRATVRDRDAQGIAEAFARSTTGRLADERGKSFTMQGEPGGS